MAFSDLPLSYCANVHPGETFPEALAGLTRYTASVCARLSRPMAVGLWMTAEAIHGIHQSPEQVQELQDFLHDHSLVCYTMNAFPFGNFHARRVKENVYLPDWTAASRRDYTLQVAALLARLLPDGVEGSISTSPCAYKSALVPGQTVESFFPQLVSTAQSLSKLYEDTGRKIRLAIEPEPGCVLETTDEVLDFFPRLWNAAAKQDAEQAVREHLGICYDVCHQAVEHEEVADSIDRIDQAGIRIQKVHVTCALELDRPSDRESREYLGQFAEERYLHQTYGRHPSGKILKLLDLTKEFASDPPAEWLECDSWRIHFHVPVDREKMGPLRTTRPVLASALQRIAKLSCQPHLEVETYTWNVLPAGSASAKPTTATIDLVEGLTSELESTYRLLEMIASGKP